MMEINGKKFESFLALEDEFERYCYSRKEGCNTCMFDVQKKGNAGCFAKWMDKYFEVDKAAENPEAEYEYQMEKLVAQSVFLMDMGFTKRQADAIASILSGFVMKPKEQIGRENELMVERLRKKINEKLADCWKEPSGTLKKEQENQEGEQ